MPSIKDLTNAYKKARKEIKSLDPKTIVELLEKYGPFENEELIQALNVFTSKERFDLNKLPRQENWERIKDACKSLKQKRIDDEKIQQETKSQRFREKWAHQTIDITEREEQRKIDDLSYIEKTSPIILSKMFQIVEQYSSLWTADRMRANLKYIEKLENQGTLESDFQNSVVMGYIFPKI